MQDGGGIINRLRDIRQEFDAGACGPLPLRVTAHGVGGLKQQPLKAGYMVLEKGSPETGQDETRENKIRRFTGGPAPMASSKLLHLIAEDLNLDLSDDSPITITWADSGVSGSNASAPDADARPIFNESALNGFSTIEFDDDRSFFEINSPPEELQTLKDKSLYLVMLYSTASGSSGPHPMAISASSTANNIIEDRFCAYAINVDTAVSFFRATSNNLGSFTSNLVSSDDSAGDDFAIVPVTDGEFIASSQVAEIIIYNSVHNSGQNAEVLKYLFCKYALLTTAEV
tara:strand:+ start:100 stop:957 length:858 start_codon:yes stop_codon:yes gene_type:complete